MRRRLPCKGVIQPQLHGIEPGQHPGISAKPLPHGSGILGKDRAAALTTTSPALNRSFPCIRASSDTTSGTSATAASR